MAPSSKNAAAAAKDRRKSSNTTTTASSVTAASSSPKPTHVVTLKVAPRKLRAIVDPDFVKEDTPAAKDSPAAAANSNADAASDSTPNSPPAAGTPAAQSVSMGPPTEGPKKKGVKRSAGAAAANGNGEPKVRGKPGPKKKQKLDDTAADGRGALAAHKLGPKANQGAINAGLRALDRSGKPCRKWNRGGFTLKSFTGVVWEIPRWTAPPKPRPAEEEDSSATTPTPASDGSNKENGGAGKGGEEEGNSMVVKSEEAASQNGAGGAADVEMRDTPSFVADQSPAPVAVAVA